MSQHIYNSFSQHGIISNDFDEYGCRWPMCHIEMIFPKIAYMSIHEQAQYVDRNVFEIIEKGNPDELEILKTNIRKPIENPNTTVFGNLAFIAIYCQEYSLKYAAFCKLNQLIKTVTLQPHNFPIQTN